MPDPSTDPVVLAWCDELTALQEKRAELDRVINDALIGFKGMAARNRKSLALQRTRAANYAVHALIDTLKALSSTSRSQRK